MCLLKYAKHLFIFKDFIDLFLERGERRETERDRNINVQEKDRLAASLHVPTTQACALPGNQTGNTSPHAGQHPTN